MDEEKKEQAQVAETPKAEVAKSSGEHKAKGMGVFAGIQFLTLFVILGVLFLQYIQFEKLVDLEKRMVEDSLVSEKQEDEVVRLDIPLSNIDTFTIVEKSNFNISDGKDTRTLIITINLGLNKKAKSYKKTTTLLGEKIQIAKEIVERIITSSDVDDLDGDSREYSLKTKIIKELSKQFETDAIVDIYFSDKFIA